MSEQQPTDTTPEIPQQSLSLFMKVSICILAAVTIASISLLFIGDFAGKFERVFSTLALFTVFVLLTAFDTRRARNNTWYAPVALIANTYILGLLLIVIWITRYDYLHLQYTITWTSIYVIVVTRLVVWAVGLLFRIGSGRPAALDRWGQITSILAIITLILFTAPIGIEAFDISVPDLYWRFAVASLILTGLGLAITLLLSWYFRSEERQELAAAAPVAAGPYPGAHAVDYSYPPAASGVGQAPGYGQTPGYGQVYGQQVPVAAYPAPPVAQGFQPWPTYADGTPYPMGVDGQPDFALVQYLEQQAAQQAAPQAYAAAAQPAAAMPPAAPLTQVFEPEPVRLSDPAPAAATPAAAEPAIAEPVPAAQPAVAESAPAAAAASEPAAVDPAAQTAAELTAATEVEQDLTVPVDLDAETVELPSEDTWRSQKNN